MTHFTEDGNGCANHILIFCEFFALNKKEYRLSRMRITWTRIYFIPKKFKLTQVYLLLKCGTGSLLKKRINV